MKQSLSQATYWGINSDCDKMKTMSAPDKTAETEAEANTKDKASLSVVRLLMPYLWPKDRPSFKLRIVLALSLIHI